jgi:hypothetical protein
MVIGGGLNEHQQASPLDCAQPAPRNAGTTWSTGKAIKFLARRNKTHAHRQNTVRWPSGAGHCDWLAPTGGQIRSGIWQSAPMNQIVPRPLRPGHFLLETIPLQDDPDQQAQKRIQAANKRPGQKMIRLGPNEP